MRAFLGLGAIGTPMARHLAKAGPLRVWNRTLSKAEAFVASHGGSLADTPAAAATDAEVVITCFPTSREVEAVLRGPTGVLAGMKPGSVLVDCTSGDPATSRRLACELAGLGIDFLDAPVSGGTAGAEAAALTIMCGGDPKVFERVQPVLRTIGKKIVHVGPVGAGDAVKAVNNAMLAVHIWSLGEGLAALKKAGVNPAVALDVINASSGRSNTSENLFPARVVTRAFPRTFRLALLEKDATMAAEFAREMRVPSAVMQQVADLFRAARVELGEESDHVEAVRLIERWANTEIGGA